MINQNTPYPKNQMFFGPLFFAFLAILSNFQNFTMMTCDLNQMFLDLYICVSSHPEHFSKFFKIWPLWLLKFLRTLNFAFWVCFDHFLATNFVCVNLTPVTLTLTFLGHSSKNKMWPPQRWPMPNFKRLCAILWSLQPRVESGEKNGKKPQETTTSLVCCKLRVCNIIMLH